jgi:hypothetical protein
MNTTAQNHPSMHGKPFVIEHRRQMERDGHHFTPSTQLIVTPALRTSGLVAALPDSEARSLLLLLTFLTANGYIQPTLPELAQGMQVTEGAARSRMERLLTFVWQGEPLVQERPRELGLDTYSPASTLLEHRPAPPEPPPDERAPIRPAGREAVYEHSRAAYARPREEAERLVAEQLGHAVEESLDTPVGQAWRRLVALGVSREQVASLLVRRTPEECLRQIEWLPYRGAKSPARFVVAAIENDYEPPLTLRLPRVMEDITPADPLLAEPVPPESEESEQNRDGVPEELAIPELPAPEDTAIENETITPPIQDATKDEWNDESPE